MLKHLHCMQHLQYCVTTWNVLTELFITLPHLLAF